VHDLKNMSFSHLSAERRAELRATARAICAPGKGILAADESSNTIAKRFASINIDNTEEHRRAYRELLFSADPDMGKHISAVILFHETLYHKASDERPLVKLLEERGIIPGIKVDTGLVPLASSSANETTTQGLDSLGQRCAEYRRDGARFAKFRCTLRVGPSLPSHLALVSNAQVLARYASICQSEGLVPIVEPEVLVEGDHTLEMAQRSTEATLSYVYRALHDHNVYLEGTLLKPNMVTPGLSCPTKTSAQEVAVATVTALQRTVPVAVPGICFLSGGLSEADSTAYLNAINCTGLATPWSLTFSFGRALQGSVLKTWQGKAENVAAAKAQFMKLARNNGAAAEGKYVAA